MTDVLLPLLAFTAAAAVLTITPGALSLAWLCLLVTLTVPLARLLSRPAVVRGLDRLTACVFVGFGLRLALSERP